MDELARETSLIYRKQVPEVRTYHWLQCTADRHLKPLLPCNLRHHLLMFSPQVAMNESDGNTLDPFLP